MNASHAKSLVERRTKIQGKQLTAEVGDLLQMSQDSRREHVVPYSERVVTKAFGHVEVAFDDLLANSTPATTRRALKKRLNPSIGATLEVSLFDRASHRLHLTISKANTIAAFRGWTPFVGLQIEYSLIERTVERELIPVAKDLGLTVTAWSPLAGGVLTANMHRATLRMRGTQAK